MVALELRAVPPADLAAFEAFEAFAERVGRSMVCLRRDGSAASASASSASPVSNEDIFDVTEDTRLLGFSAASLVVD